MPGMCVFTFDFSEVIVQVASLFGTSCLLDGMRRSCSNELALSKRSSRIYEHALKGFNT